MLDPYCDSDNIVLDPFFDSVNIVLEPCSPHYDSDNIVLDPFFDSDNIVLEPCSRLCDSDNIVPKSPSSHSDSDNASLESALPDYGSDMGSVDPRFPQTAAKCLRRSVMIQTLDSITTTKGTQSQPREPEPEPEPEPKPELETQPKDDSTLQKSASALPPPPKTLIEAYLLWLVLGMVGGHHFYLRRPAYGLAYSFTLGLLGFGWLMDMFRMPSLVRDSNLKGNNPKIAHHKSTMDAYVLWFPLGLLGKVYIL